MTYGGLDTDSWHKKLMRAKTSEHDNQISGNTVDYIDMFPS